MISNVIDEEVWNAFHQMIEILVTKFSLASLDTLFAWRQHVHIALAKEPYSWRGVLDALKDSDLSEICQAYKGKEEFALMTDKPKMLKIGGEITNGLMHSYTSKHKISFRQIVSKEPPFFAL